MLYLLQRSCDWNCHRFKGKENHKTGSQSKSMFWVSPMNRIENGQIRVWSAVNVNELNISARVTLSKIWRRNGLRMLLLRMHIAWTNTSNTGNSFQKRYSGLWTRLPSRSLLKFLLITWDTLRELPNFSTTCSLYLTLIVVPPATQKSF